ncbi:hypothetical protein JW905_14435 [bacterium]|nr:hypothetical protein [candidate division CSSED10-310 bacterium]
MMKRSVVVLTLLLITSTISAAPYVPPGEITWGFVQSGATPDTNVPRTRSDYLAELEEIADFLATWQLDDPGNEEHGGMIEDEFHPPEDRIIESDNTQEAIWVWSRYHELMGDVRYAGNVSAAWEYLQHFPAWEEAPPQFPDSYYIIWNCGWGMRCEMQYRHATGDETFRDYGVTCADYLLDHEPRLDHPSAGTNLLHHLTVAWTAWNLHAYATEAGRQDWLDRAEYWADLIKTWVEEDTDRINSFAWALGGGLGPACVLEVLFNADPGGAATWRDTFLTGLVLLFPPDHDPNPVGSDWMNAWNSWQALAQSALWRTTGGFDHRLNALDISDHLRSLDGDDDGGIPASENDDDDHDQTWVSTYITLMGFADLEEPPRLLLSMEDTQLEPGDTFRTVTTIQNPGLEAGVDLYIALEVYGSFFFFPDWQEAAVAIPLDLPIGYDLARDLVGADWIPILEFTWPPAVGIFTATWWGVMLEPGSTEVVGDILNFEWSAV